MSTSYTATMRGKADILEGPVIEGGEGGAIAVRRHQQWKAPAARLARDADPNAVWPRERQGMAGDNGALLSGRRCADM